MQIISWFGSKVSFSAAIYSPAMMVLGNHVKKKKKKNGHSTITTSGLRLAAYRLGLELLVELANTTHFFCTFTVLTLAACFSIG